MQQQLSRSLRIRLSVLWILEWGITGSLMTYLPLYFQHHNVPLNEVGPLLAVAAIGLWVAPIVTGQICDRWMSIERYMSIAHLLGGITLLAIPVAVQAEWFRAVFWLLGLYAALYLPTMPLASALTFRHLPDPDTQFGRIRVWGTVGWVLSGIGLSVWLQREDVQHWLRETWPSTENIVYPIYSLFNQLPGPSSDDAFHIAAVLSFVLSSFCVFLPPTPPVPAKNASFAPMQALATFRERSFILLALFSFLLGLVIPLYTLAVPSLLEQAGCPTDWVPAMMTVGQISEFPALLMLPLFLRRFGLKGTFALGILAWATRYALFAFDPGFFLTLAGVALHGVCHVFLIIVIQLYIDSRCEKDQRASAQNLFAFLSLGIAMPLGMVLSSPLVDAATETIGEVATVHYDKLFGYPALILLILLAAFQLVFPRVTDSVRDASESVAGTNRTSMLIPGGEGPEARVEGPDRNVGQ